MSTTSVTEYRIYCTTQGAWQYVWGTVPPTTCPTDTAHAVNPNSVQEVQVVSSTKIEVEQVAVDPAGGASPAGYFRFMTTRYTAAAAVSPTVPTTTVHDFSYPYPVAIATLGRMSAQAEYGNSMSLYVLPLDPTADFLTASVAIGATTISVAGTIFAAVKVGFHIFLGTGSMTEANFLTYEALGDVLSFDATALTVTFETPCVAAYAPGTLVYLALCPLKDAVIGHAAYRTPGENTLGSTFLKANNVVRAVYTNHVEAPVDVITDVQCFY
jgi:hypothetical protein